MREALPVSAEECINETVEQAAGSPDTFLQDVKGNAEHLEQQEKAKVYQYIDGVRGAIQGAVIADLPTGIGGTCSDQHIQIAEDALAVGDSIEMTIAKAQEIGDHEKYHRDNHHSAPMKVGASAKGDTVATIGREKFTDKRLVEALTVHETGNRFVAQSYIEHVEHTTRALVRANLDWNDLAEAINEKKDYGLVDDHSRAMAA